MKEIIFILLLGILIQRSVSIQKSGVLNQINELVLLGLLFGIGISIGKERKNIARVKKTIVSTISLPIGIVIGSLIGGIIAGIFTNTSFYESLAVASGMGFYSVSSAIISSKGLGSLATITFLSSSMREIIAILLAPLLAKIHKLAPVGAAGATASDIALPAIIKAAGEEAGIVSFMSGFVITILVPFLTAFLVNFI